MRLQSPARLDFLLHPASPANPVHLASPASPAYPANLEHPVSPVLPVVQEAVGTVERVGRVEDKAADRVEDIVEDIVVGKMNCMDYNHCRCWGRDKTFLYTYL